MKKINNYQEYQESNITASVAFYLMKEININNYLLPFHQKNNFIIVFLHIGLKQTSR